MFNALLHDFGHQGMQAERSRDEVGYAGVGAGGFRGESRDVLVPMSTRSKEVGENHDALCSATHALGECRCERWFGQLHMRGLNDRT